MKSLGRFLFLLQIFQKMFHLERMYKENDISERKYIHFNYSPCIARPALSFNGFLCFILSYISSLIEQARVENFPLNCPVLISLDTSFYRHGIYV